MKLSFPINDMILHKTAAIPVHWIILSNNNYVRRVLSHLFETHGFVHIWRILTSAKPSASAGFSAKIGLLYSSFAWSYTQQGSIKVPEILFSYFFLLRSSQKEVKRKHSPNPDNVGITIGSGRQITFTITLSDSARSLFHSHSTELLWHIQNPCVFPLFYPVRAPTHLLFGVYKM